MALFSRPEYSIGRGETAESQVEVPFFVGFMFVCAVGVLLCHLYFRNTGLTIALAISMVIFGATFVKVELGVYVLVICMLLSPEIEAGQSGMGTLNINIRYDDILIIVVFLGVLVKQAFEGRNALWRPSPINSGIILYYAICLFSTLLAMRRALPLFEANKQTTMFVLLKMAEYYMVFVLVGSAIRDKKQVRKQLGLFFAVAVIVAVFGIHSRFGAIERVSAPFEKGGTEPNTLGGYLVLVICLAAALFTQAPTRRLRILFLCLGLTCFFPLLFTLSRASYIGFVFGMFTLAIIARKPLLIAGLVLLMALSPLVMPEDVKNRVAGTFQPGGESVYVGDVNTGLKVDKSTHERIYVWQKVRFNLHFWPWFGGGVYWDRVLDSQYARVLIETGIFGMAAFLFLQWRLIRTTAQAFYWCDDWVGRALGLATLAGTIALIAHSIGTISFLIVRIMEPYWFLVALAVVSRGIAIEDFLKARLAGNGLDAPPEEAPAPSEPEPQPAPVVTRTAYRT